MTEIQLDEQAAWLTDLISESNAPGLSYIDVAPFLSPSFDPQEYANAIIESPTHGTYRSAAKGSTVASSSRASATDNPASWVPQSGRVDNDLSVALGRLNIAIDEVDRLIRDEVTSNASALLTQTASLMDLKPTLATLTQALEALDNHQTKLVERISNPRNALQLHTVRLSRIRSAQRLIKRAQRFVRLLRRLQSQMQGFDDRRNDDKAKLESLGEEEAQSSIDGTNAAAAAAANDDLLDLDFDDNAGRGLSRVALTLAEINSLLRPDMLSQAKTEGDDKIGAEDSSMLDLTFVQDCLPIIEDARERVTDLMENMIVRGLRDLSPTMLSTALQTAYNLGQLTDLVRDLLADLTDVIRDRVHAAFDMHSLARELGTKEPQTQQSTSYRARRGEYSSASHQKWTASIWTRIETLVIGEMGAVCSKVYTLERVLSLKDDNTTGVNYLNSAVDILGAKPSSMFWSTLASAIEKEINLSSSPFLLQTLELGYPRLLRLLQEFYGKISVYTATMYSHTQQSSETLVVLRSLARLEQGFLTKLSTRFETFLSNSFTSKEPPNAKEATTLAKMALTELDNAKADPVLFHAVEEVVFARLSDAQKRLEDLVVRDPSTQTLHSISSGLVRNASLTVATYHLIAGLRSTVQYDGEEPRKDKLSKKQSQLQAFYDTCLVKPLLKVICKDVSDSMSRMHYVDFGLDRDAVSGSGSAYMADLADKMWFLREQLFVHYDLPTGAWLLQISRHALRSFVMNASLIRPLAEGGKLKLTSDMTELEFSVSQLLASAHQTVKPLTMNDCGVDFTSLRSFRHLLFSDPASWPVVDALQAGLSPVAAAHHIIARSRTISLPHELRRWTRVEYLRWLDDHSRHDAIDLLGNVLEAWQAVQSGEGANESDRVTDEALIVVVKRIVSLCSGPAK